MHKRFMPSKKLISFRPVFFVTKKLDVNSVLINIILTLKENLDKTMILHRSLPKTILHANFVCGEFCPAILVTDGKMLCLKFQWYLFSSIFHHSTTEIKSTFILHAIFFLKLPVLHQFSYHYIKIAFFLLMFQVF